jgi:hypothetical protein
MARLVVACAVAPVLVERHPLDRLASSWVARRGAHRFPADGERVAAAVDRLLAPLPWPWTGTCLRRSAVLFALARRGGLDPRLCVGVRRDEQGVVRAHAWLERDGAPWLEPSHTAVERYAVIARVPSGDTAPLRGLAWE